GGINIKLYDTYFAARVKACNTRFDQIFFIVDNRIHPVLLSLPALINAKCRLLTVYGHDMMPGIHQAMTLDLTKVDQRREQATHGLNTLAYKMIEDGPVQTSAVTWKNLDFHEFGPQPICMLTEQFKLIIQSEQPVEPPPQSVAEVQGRTSNVTNASEAFPSGSDHSVSEPIPIPTTCAFEPPMDSNEFDDDDESPGIPPHCPLSPPDNVRWQPEFTSEQLRHIKETEHSAFEQNFDFCVRMSPPSDYDWEKQFDPPVSA
ncbi:MAG: hypothetical protein GY847_09500, partial [Proteobacteria bacterium]|nr:hypothetical protein [Pseudomonadota bacterium]